MKVISLEPLNTSNSMDNFDNTITPASATGAN